ncbi:MAG: hypothetical protein KKH52_03325 [Nanoarchaeota archaeon]|nr:hypothetical protein [Nanoarchaeota archaeon]MBU1623099.1 hypothetical protein [Nanoarchaeota archaeon]MBU1974399.1 hypothetical protein [Nanoarchaeota archaeon]
MILQIVFALIGIVLGIVLGYLAKEEVHPGKKYLLGLKKFLLGLIFLLVGYSAFINGHFVLFILPLLLLIGFLLELKLKNKYVEVGYYIVFVIAYVFFPSSLLASLIFLYGLPTGTLLIKKLI